MNTIFQSLLIHKFISSWFEQTWRSGPRLISLTLKSFWVKWWPQVKRTQSFSCSLGILLPDFGLWVELPLDAAPLDSPFLSETLSLLCNWLTSSCVRLILSNAFLDNESRVKSNLLDSSVATEEALPSWLWSILVCTPLIPAKASTYSPPAPPARKEKIPAS